MTSPSIPVIVLAVLATLLSFGAERVKVMPARSAREVAPTYDTVPRVSDTAVNVVSFESIEKATRVAIEVGNLEEIQRLATAAVEVKDLDAVSKIMFVAIESGNLEAAERIAKTVVEAGNLEAVERMVKITADAGRLDVVARMIVAAVEVKGMGTVERIVKTVLGRWDYVYTGHPASTAWAIAVRGRDAEKRGDVELADKMYRKLEELLERFDRLEEKKRTQ